MGKTSKVLGKSGYSLDVQTQSPLDIRTGGLVNSTENKENRHSGDKTVSVEGLQHSPAFSPEWDERLTKVASFSSKTAESFRVLRSKILLPQDGRPAPKTIMVTSALPREGKSFISANLGIALAQGVDQHSLLVDCDLRVPSLAQLFGVPSERGLVDYLQNSDDLSSLLQKTSLEKLSVLASGVPPVNPAELLGSERMHKLVEELARRYPDRYVIFDTPPLEVASESKVLSQAVDGVVLVVRQGISNRTLIEKFISDIGKDKIIGVIFNGHKSNFISTRLVDKSHYYYGNYYSKQAE
jgi:protein-tyrosine kinase